MKNETFISFENIWYSLLFGIIKLALNCIIDFDISMDHTNTMLRSKVIYVGNHYSSLDAVSVISFLPCRIYPVMAHDVAASFPIWQLIVRLLAKSIGCIFIHRDGKSNISAMKLMINLLERGKCIFITPEGDRSPNGQLMQAYNGAVFAAIKTHSDLIPIATFGYENLSENLRKFKKTKISISFGPEISLGQFGNNYDLATDYVMRKIAELLPFSLRGKYT